MSLDAYGKPSWLPAGQRALVWPASALGPGLLWLFFRSDREGSLPLGAEGMYPTSACGSGPLKARKASEM